MACSTNIRNWALFTCYLLQRKENFRTSQNNIERQDQHNQEMILRSGLLRPDQVVPGYDSHRTLKKKRVERATIHLLLRTSISTNRSSEPRKVNKYNRWQRRSALQNSLGHFSEAMRFLFLEHSHKHSLYVRETLSLLSLLALVCHPPPEMRPKGSQRFILPFTVS